MVEVGQCCGQASGFVCGWTGYPKGYEAKIIVEPGMQPRFCIDSVSGSNSEIFLIHVVLSILVSLVLTFANVVSDV